MSRGTRARARSIMLRCSIGSSVVAPSRRRNYRPFAPPWMIYAAIDTDLTSFILLFPMRSTVRTIWGQRLHVPFQFFAGRRAVVSRLKEIASGCAEVTSREEIVPSWCGRNLAKCRKRRVSGRRSKPRFRCNRFRVEAG